MKRIFLSIAAIAVSLCGLAQKYVDPMTAKHIYDAYHVQYPQAELQDFYKYCFQGYMGPEHLISDAKSVATYLDKELSESKSFGGPLYEYVGIKGDYVRVNLSVVADGYCPKEIFLRAFLESTGHPQGFEAAEWPVVWEEVLQALPVEAKSSKESQQFLRSLHKVLSNGDYAFHHSARFNQAYGFHYRIFSRRSFDQWLRPLLSQHFMIK